MGMPTLISRTSPFPILSALGRVKSDSRPKSDSDLFLTFLNYWNKIKLTKQPVKILI